MGTTMSTTACSLGSNSAMALAMAILGTGIQLNSAFFSGNCNSAATLSSTGVDASRGGTGLASGAYFSTGSVSGSTVFEPQLVVGMSKGTSLSTSFDTAQAIDSLCSKYTDANNFYDANVLRMEVTLQDGFNGFGGRYIYGSDEATRPGGLPNNDLAIIAIDGTTVNNRNVVGLSASNSGELSPPEYWHFKRTSNLQSITQQFPTCVGTHIIEIGVCDAIDSLFDSAVVVTMSGIAGNSPGMACTTTTTTTESTTTTTDTTTTETTTETTTTTTTTEEPTTTTTTTTEEPTTTTTTTTTTTEEPTTTTTTTTTTEEPTTTATTTMSTTTAPATTTGGTCITCKKDACLSVATNPAFVQPVSSFCAAFTTAVGGVQPPANLALACNSLDNAFSSVCTCLQKIVTAMPTTTTTSSPPAEIS